MKRAILIGINGYPAGSGLAPLKFAEADARQLGRALGGSLGFQTTLLLGRQATRESIEDAMAAVGQGELLLFFFAGHGQLIKGHYHLHPVDSVATGARAISFEFFHREWQGETFGYEKVLAILDACRSEAVGMRGGQRGFSAEEVRDVVAATRGRRQVEVLYGCEEGQVSYEDPDLGQGILTHALLGVLAETQGYLDTDLLAGDAADRMKEWSQQDKQGRWQVAYQYRIPSVKQKLVLFGDPEGAAWEKARQKNSVEAFMFYLEQFSQGAHAPAAQAALQDLREVAAWTKAQAVNTVAACEHFLDEWSQGRHAPEARHRIAALQAEEQAWQAARRADTPKHYQAFADNYPDSHHADAATRRLQEMEADGRDWAAAQAAKTLAAVEDYLAQTQEEQHRESALTWKRACQDNDAWASASQARDLAAVRDYQVTYGKLARHLAEAVELRQTLEAEAQVERARHGELCPACGLRNDVANTFRCRVCGQDFLCRGQFVTAERCCEECAEKAAQAKTEQQREVKARSLACPQIGGTHRLDLGGGVSFELCGIPAGEFRMGSLDGADDEKPVRLVRITQPFWMGKYAVTQVQYRAVMGANPSTHQGADKPVHNISWEDATEFCQRLSQKAGQTVRLPTEAEWEYACRAGTTTHYYHGDSEDGLADVAWYGRWLGGPEAVGQKRPNLWGLYDMHGNVWEWCQDWYGPYPGVDVADPKGPATGSNRVLRGGSWGSDAFYCRTADRFIIYPTVSYIDFGVRPVLPPGQP